MILFEVSCIILFRFLVSQLYIPVWFENLKLLLLWTNLIQFIKSEVLSSCTFGHTVDWVVYFERLNSVLENFLDNLDLTQKGWSSKLVSKIQNSLADGGGEIEFNLKPKNLGMLKVSVKLKEGIGSVKIIAENSFVTTALNQNENYLQKLFNDQGINLEFLAKNENQNFGSNNQSNQNSNNEKENQNRTAEKKDEILDEIEIEDNSSRHIINVIA